jgi:NADH dehydrogenase
MANSTPDALPQTSPFAPKPTIVIGGGFGGLRCAQELGGTGIPVILIDRRNFHLFQPLLYQVATGMLSPANITSPLRRLTRFDKNVTTLMDDVTGIDVAARTVTLRSGRVIEYGNLVVAAGAVTSYFGNNQWAEHAIGMKSIEEATIIRARVLSAFEKAERSYIPGQMEHPTLRFVVVGAGPTGVEMAGAISEICHHAMAGEFRNIDPTKAEVLLIDGADRVLPPFHPTSSAAAQKQLEDIHVKVLLKAKALDVGPGYIKIATPEGEQTIQSSVIIWAAGVTGAPLGAVIAKQTGVPLERGGRVRVEPDCSLANHPEIFVIGDLGHYQHGTERPIPGVAPAAVQQGEYVAKVILARHDGEHAPKPFEYHDKGSMAIIGRSLAVAEMPMPGKKSWKFSGHLAWMAWLFVHIMYLTRFQNRILVLVQWGWQYIGKGRSARMITSINGTDA